MRSQPLARAVRMPQHVRMPEARSAYAHTTQRRKKVYTCYGSCHNYTLPQHTPTTHLRQRCGGGVAAPRGVGDGVGDGAHVAAVDGLAVGRLAVGWLDGP